MDLSEKIRIYYDYGDFDEGKIRTISEDEVVVDFLDWIESFHPDQFEKQFPHNGLEVLVPKTRGTIVRDFRKDG